MHPCSKPSAVRKNPYLTSVMLKLYADRKKTGDVKFIIDAEVIHAHRCVLAAVSPKYETQFFGAAPEKDVINVNGVSPAAFNEFLQFFYTENISLTIGNIEDVLKLAKQSLVDDLVVHCTNFLIDIVGMDKLRWCYRLALNHENKLLEDFCVKHISENITDAFRTMDFWRCEHDVLCHLLDHDALNCNEIDIFDACMLWAQAKCQHERIDATNTANLRAVLGDAVFKIRFCCMKADDFATIDKKYSGFLSAEESNEVFHAILLKDNHKTSNKFGNCKPRKSIPSTLECLVSRGSRILLDSVIHRKMFGFYCDEEIELNGFVLCNQNEGDIEVDIITDKGIQRPKITTVVSHDETRIRFNDPVLVAKGALHWISFKLDASQPSSSKSYGYHLKGATKEHGILFKFLDSLDITIFTRLLFNTIYSFSSPLWIE